MRKQLDDPTGIKGSLENTVDPDGTLRETIAADFTEEETLTSKETPVHEHTKDSAPSLAVQTETFAASDGQAKKKIEQENRKGVEDKVSPSASKISRNEEKSAKSENIRLAILKYGTVNWEINVIESAMK